METDDHRGWRERYGVANFEAHHWIAVLGVGFVLAAPFFALVQPAAGFLAIVVGMLALIFSSHVRNDAQE